MKRLAARQGGRLIADNVKSADRFLERLRGLMWKKGISDGEGLLLVPCGQIHTFFMRFPIDAIFLSESGEILHAEQAMAPGRISPHIKGCFQVLELNGGAIRMQSIALSGSIHFEEIQEAQEALWT